MFRNPIIRILLKSQSQYASGKHFSQFEKPAFSEVFKTKHHKTHQNKKKTPPVKVHRQLQLLFYSSGHRGGKQLHHASQIPPNKLALAFPFLGHSALMHSPQQQLSSSMAKEQEKWLYGCLWEVKPRGTGLLPTTEGSLQFPSQRKSLQPFTASLPPVPKSSELHNCLSLQPLHGSQSHLNTCISGPQRPEFSAAFQHGFPLFISDLT